MSLLTYEVGNFLYDTTGQSKKKERFILMLVLGFNTYSCSMQSSRLSFSLSYD